MKGARQWTGKAVAWRAGSLARRAGFRLRDRLAPPDPAPRIRALVAQLRAQKGQLRVGFVVCDPSKWSAGPLFSLLASDPAFRCVFHLALSDTARRLPSSDRRAEFERLGTFFSTIGPLGAALYSPATDRIHPPTVLDCDLAIIQQPWGMQDLPRRLLHQGVLSAYVHYGYPIISNDIMQFGLPDFHGFLWAYVAASEMHREMVVDGTSAPFSVIVAGHPKLDTYLTPAPSRNEIAHWPRPAEEARRRVIYAPHHTLDGTLNMATFAWSGAVMLELARANPEVDFLLKPHPNLALAMKREGEGQRFAAWVRAWSDLPNAATYESGNYFGLFRTSDLLITDSGSFLAEYLPTGAPILRLTRPDAAPMNRAGEALVPAFYTAATAEELRMQFAQLVHQDDDPLADLRAQIARLVAPRAPGSAKILRDRLLAELRGSVSPPSLPLSP
jgi:hypothetical protein